MSPSSGASADAGRKLRGRCKVATLDYLRNDFGLGLCADMDWTWSRKIRGDGLDTDINADRSRTWIVRGHGQTAVMIADWMRARTDHGRGNEVTAIAEVTRTPYGRASIIVLIFPGHCAAVARRTPGRFIGYCADIARLADLPSSKGMVSRKNHGFHVSESRQRTRSFERLKTDDPGRTERAF